MKTCALVALLAVIVLAGCGSSGSSMSGSNSGGAGGSGGDVTVIVQGNWQITTTSQSGMNGGAGAVFQQNFQTGVLSGSAGNLQPACATTATLSGSISLNTVKFTLNESGQSVNFSGAVSGQTMSGTFNAPSGGCTNGASGTWTASRIPLVTGTWNGSLSPASGGQLPFQLAVPLTQDDGGNVTGTATVTGSSCFTTLALNTPNSIAGLMLVMEGQAGDGVSVELPAKLNSSATSMEVNYTVSGGSCDGQTGTGVLTKQ